MQSLIEHQQRKKSSVLLGLAIGSPICLAVHPRMVQHKRRVENPRLMIMLMSSFGGDPKELMFALEGRGCEVMRTDDLKWELLWRMGFTEVAAKALIDEIQKVLSGDNV